MRDKEKREVDFAVVVDGSIESLIEVKVSDSTVPRSLRRFAQVLQPATALLLVESLDLPMTGDGVDVQPVASWLSKLSI